MTIRMFCVGMVSVWWIGLACAADRETARPNVVIFLVDDMGVMDTSVPFLTDPQGQPKRYPLNDFYRTPNMERLARQGIRCNNFCAMSVCSPTRCSILTGQNAARHHTTNWINPDHNNRGPFGPPDWNWNGLTAQSITLPRILQTAGYRTIHVGKGHFAPRNTAGADPTQLGFTVNVAGSASGAPASYWGQQNFGNGGKRAAYGVPGLEKYHGTDTFLTEALTREATAQVSAAVQAHQPFFLYLAHYAVHAPFQTDARFAEHYRHAGKPQNAQAFATLIEGMDKSLGDLLDHLEKLGVAENTVIFFLGDNGSDAPLGDPHAVASAAPLRGKKGSHYEGGMRVPFLAAWAKPQDTHPCQKRFPIGRNAIQPQIAAVMDLFPTILGLAQVPTPAGHVVDGQRLDTLLRGQVDRTRKEEFLMHYPHAPHRSHDFTSYRAGEWKIVYHYEPASSPSTAHYQLFHLTEDPFESTDLAGSHPRELRDMAQKMMASLTAHHAQYPVGPDGRTPILPRLP
ncbi:MAG: sulfatase [Bacteroidales bacterium]|nr:sulfatase [Bacteroidales bacterium]